VYNEEKVLAEKLKTILQLNYPKELLHLFIGNDLSNDNSLSIIENKSQNFHSIQIINAEKRSGKPALINALAKAAKEKLGNEIVFLITDANVQFHPKMLFEMVKNFKNKNIGLVGANVVNNASKSSTVSELESIYVSRENKMKYFEGRFHGALMGPFGACFALRSNAFVEIPTHFIVDDFYLCMKIHDQKLQCIYETAAVCYEDVPGNMWEEFRRKSRIAAGNFQNLFCFWKWIFRPFSAVGFTFFSHKILRWLTPFLAIGGLVLVWKLSDTHLHHDLYDYIFWYKLVFWLLLLLDFVLVFFNIHFKPLRLLTYFYFMNVAIIWGFIKFLKGIRSAAWQPTARNVE